MIIAETDSGYQFVTQPAHAELAGRFADQWGSDSFSQSNRDAALRTAAYTHDNGWYHYDQQPHRNSSGLVDFRSPPPDTWIQLYDDGIERVIDIDRYAGLLVSLHGSGLRRRRYGLSPSWPAPTPPFSAFVDRQEQRQRELLESLLDDPSDDRVSSVDLELLRTIHSTGAAPDHPESSLWFDYRLLQAWDVMSLAFCVTDSPPGYDSIDSVPKNPTQTGSTLSIVSIDDQRFRITPYPFTTDPLECWLPYRTIPNPSLSETANLTQRYYGTSQHRYEFTLVS